MEVLFLLVLLELALSLNGESLVLDAHIEVLLLNAWHLKLQHNRLVVLVDVDRRYKVGCGQRALALVQIAKKRIDAVL